MDTPEGDNASRLAHEKQLRAQKADAKAYGCVFVGLLMMFGLIVGVLLLALL